MPNQSYFEGQTISSAMFAATRGVHDRGEIKESFDLVTQIASGRCLLVGEGNLSFARSLLNFQRISASKIVATTFERLNSLSEDAITNAKFLSAKGVVVLNGVNARKLDVAIGSNKFSTIVFQFPHTGRRHPVEGKNPNYVLVRDFLNSARSHLIQNARYVFQPLTAHITKARSNLKKLRHLLDIIRHQSIHLHQNASKDIAIQ